MVGNDLRKLERSFGIEKDSIFSKNLVSWTSSMIKTRTKALLQETQQDRDTIIGELRVLYKLLTMLEPTQEEILVP